MLVIRFLILTPLCSILFGAQSVAVGASASVTLPNTAPWTTIGSTSMRWEMRLHAFGADFPTTATVAPAAFEVRVLAGSGNLMASNDGNGPDTIPDGLVFARNCCAGQTDMLVRVQRDVANLQYTIEVCPTTGGNCITGTATITKLGQASWVGRSVVLNAGLYQLAFLRWFSGVVPIGAPIPIGNVAGDLGDWEFDGNLLDSSGHGLKLNGGSVSYSATPTYAPACNAGAQQSFRAGHPAVLNGSASYPLDGGTFLSYVWQLLSGPSALTWSSHSVAAPQIRGLVFGSYVLQLTVADSSNQSSSCTVKDGAVATDDNNTVITNNPAVDTLLGPMVRYGANPWPWFDSRNKELADLQLGTMDANFPDYWDTPAAGTVSVVNGSAMLVGNGTAFTNTFAPGVSVVIWYNNGANRRLNGISSVTDDTHAVLAYAWDAGTTESHLQYSAAPGPAVVNWGYAQVSLPGNYYDNVAAYYALYYRSGLDTYLSAARALADRFWASPPMDQGLAFAGTYQFKYTGRSHSLLGMVLRALDGRPDMWPGLHIMWGAAMYYLSGPDTAANWGMWDQREVAYHLLEVSYCALFDVDATYRAQCQMAISKSFAAPGYVVWQPSRSPDGSFPALYSSLDLVHSVIATNGSPIVTGNGTAWATGQFNSPLLLYSGFPSKAPNNSKFDTSVYVPTVNSPTQLTLDRTFQGTSGTYGWSVGSYGVAGWGSQPFMEGIQTAAFIMASKAIATSDPANSALAVTYAEGLANWLKTYGYSDPASGGVGGMYYFANFVNCSYPIQTQPCTLGMTASQSRTDAAEAVRGLMLVYEATGDASLRDFIDLVYSQMYSKPGTSTQFPGDGSYISDLDDGQSFMGGGAPANKWLGFFFGFDNGAAWPAYRMGGPQPGTGELLYVAASVTDVPGAVAVRVVATSPSGATTRTTCSSSPCAVSVDPQQNYALSIQYLSATGAVLASSPTPLIGGQ